jgi:hypothetical protein
MKNCHNSIDSYIHNYNINICDDLFLLVSIDAEDEESGESHTTACLASLVTRKIACYR